MAATTTSRFSIRNYAAMRRKNIEAGESWPLPAEKLPPISVRRFLWWEDELPKSEKMKGEIREAGKEEGKRGRKRPLKGSAMTEASALKKKKERIPLTMPSSPSHLHQESTFPRKTLPRADKIVAERSKKRLKMKTLKMKQSILTTPSQSILKKKERPPFNAKTSRRVTFSENNNFLCHSKRPSNNGLPHLTNLCKIISEVLSASSAMSHEVQPAKESLQISTISESADLKEAALSQISVLKSSNNYHCSENASSLKEMIDLNQAAVDYTEESSSAGCTQSVDPNQKEQQKISLPSVSNDKQRSKHTDADINFSFQGSSYPSISSNSMPVNVEMRIHEKYSNDFLFNKQIQSNDNEIHFYSKKNQWDLWRSSESTCSEKSIFPKNEALNMKKMHQLSDLNARKAKALTMRLMGRNVVVGCSNRDFKREAGNSQTVYRKNIYPTDFGMTHQSYPMMMPSQQSTTHNNFLNSIYFKHAKGVSLVKSKSQVQYHVQESSQHVQKQRSEKLPHWLYLAKLQMMNQSSS